MMHSDKPFLLCWTAENARSIFRTEALEGNDAIFLATHSPIKGFDVGGRDQGEFTSRTEHEVLDTLSNTSRQHAFCVVQGEPGSGKSHLIRWLSVNWPHKTDLKLLLRRSDGSLEGAFRQLREKLGAEYEDLFQNLGVRQKASTQGRANNFLATLANSLNPGHYDDQIGDESWCGKYRPDLLFQHELIRENWPAPLRIVKLIEGASGERNSASASFDLYDIADLNFDTLRKAKLLLSNPGTKELARRLEREIQGMVPYREHQWTANELAAEKVEEFPTSLALLAALNRRRNDSIQSVLGVSAEGLKTLFRRVREALQSKGMRLVLLLEDITSWEGLDDSLIDSLVFNAEASGDEDEPDVCPLISVVGVTPKYYNDLQANYRQRITHEIILGRSDGGAQDVAALRDPVERTAFMARYLSAVRAGPQALRAWREDLKQGSSIPPPNTCLTCPKNESCIAVFGSQGEISLFPFTEHAIHRFFEALKVDDRGQTWRTPRGILQAVLNPVLEQVDKISDGSFPGEGVERTAFEENRKSNSAPTRRLSEIISAQVDLGDQGRFRRLVTYWGEPDRSDTSLLEGTAVFAGLPKPLVEAFSLPWIGGTTPDAIGSNPTSEPSPVAPDSSPKDSDSPRQDHDPFPKAPDPSPKPETARPQPQPASSGPKLTPPRRRGRTPTEREKLRQDLQVWASGAASEYGSSWNEELHSILMRIEPHRIGVAPALLERVVTKEMVKLEGTTAGARDYLMIERADWVRDGLEARLAIQYDSEMSMADRAFHLRNLALMMRRLGVLVKDYLRRRFPISEDGSLWSPVPALAQVLLARAWLRGFTKPASSLAKQLSDILSDETDSGVSAQARSAPWQEWLNKTRPWHAQMREDLRDMVALPTESGAKGMIYSGELVSALQRMSETGQADPVPEHSGRWPSSLSAIEAAHNLVTVWNTRRSQIESVEFKQLRDRTRTIAERLRSHSIASHLKRVDRVVSSASETLGNKGVDHIQTWKKALAEYESETPNTDAIEELIVTFDEEDSFPSSLPGRLAWLADRPAGDVEDLGTLLHSGESAIKAMYEHANDIVSDGGAGASLATIKAVGSALQDASCETISATDAT